MPPTPSTINHQPSTAYILLAGRFTLPANLHGFPAPELVVAADGGARHASALGLSVDAWVGDFDSSQGVAVDSPRETHPAAKDQTDGELAAHWALERGCTRLVLVGAFGGRFDHVAAVALGAVRLVEQRGAEVWLTSGNEHARPLLAGAGYSRAGLSLSVRAGATLSVVALSDLRGLSLSGVRWPLAGADVPLGSGWTVSNVALASKASINRLAQPQSGGPSRGCVDAKGRGPKAEGGRQEVKGAGAEDQDYAEVHASLREGRALVVWHTGAV